MRKHSHGKETKIRAANAARVADPPSKTMIGSPDECILLHPHRFEQDVRNRLMSEPNLNFKSLVVRRINNGVCLEGVLETDDDSTHIEHLVRRIADVPNVRNCLVLRRSRTLPPKG